MARVDTKSYIGLEGLFITPDPFLKQIRETAPKHLRDIQLSATEGNILYFLLSLMGARNVLELGTLVGYSTLWIAKALGDSGRIVTIEKDQDNFDIAKNNFRLASELGYGCDIELLNTDALQALPTLPATSFDAIFIDANKAKYPSYLNYAEGLVRKGGLIIADNTLLMGYLDKPIEEVPPRFLKLRDSMLKFNQTLADNTRYKSILVPTKEGMTAAIKLF